MTDPEARLAALDERIADNSPLRAAAKLRLDAIAREYEAREHLDTREPRRHTGRPEASGPIPSLVHDAPRPVRRERAPAPPSASTAYEREVRERMRREELNRPHLTPSAPRRGIGR